MENEKFAQALKKLNKEQKEAVETTEGVVMVIAGPGTGKTEVLTMRIANIIDKKLTIPEKILALTFTESGVSSMRGRLIDLIGTPGYKVTIATFHGFANDIIKEHSEQFDDIINSKNIEEIDQIKIIKEIIDSIPLKKLSSFSDKYHHINDIKKAINELKKEGVSPKQFEEFVIDEKNTVLNQEDLYHESGAYKGKMKVYYKNKLENNKKNEELLLIYEAYEKALRDKHYYDYNDMIMYVSKTLQENEDLKMELQDKYKYILIDEHQDTNEAQNKIIKSLGNENENPNIFIVGDQKQAIYRFQGASLANFEYFKTLYKNAKIFTLKNNYRSTQIILNAAQGLFPQYDELSAQNNYPEKKISLLKAQSSDEEYYFIAKTIKELVEQGTQPDEIVVLYRENKDANPIARALEKQKISTNIESDKDIFEDDDIQKLLTIFKTIQKFGADEELPNFLQIDLLKIIPLDFYKLSIFSSLQRINMYEVIKSKELLEQSGVENKSKILEIYNKLSEWKNISLNIGAIKAFEKIIEESNFVIYLLQQSDAIEKLAKLDSVFEYLKYLVENDRNYKLNDFFEQIDLLKEHKISIKINESLKPANRPRLMTAHKSKGLQFEYVFIANAINSKWGPKKKINSIKLPNKIYNPIIKAEEDIKEVDDERKLFYVALTRAKKEVFITMSEINREGRKQEEVQFIGEIKPELITKIDINVLKKEFLDNIETELTPTHKNPDIEDKTFLNNLFEKQGLSATAINNYIDCPWHYFYENLIKIPRGTNINLSFGNIIHRTLKRFFDEKNKNNNIEKEKLIKIFKEEIEKEAIEEDDYKKLLEKGVKTLTEYYDLHAKDWIFNTINELNIKDIKLNNSIKLNGKIDKIELLDNKNNVKITDYKTGTPKSRNTVEGINKEAGAGNHKRQIIFYNILLQEMKEYNVVQNQIDFIETNKNGKDKSIDIFISKTDIEEFKNKIIEIAEEIKNLSFWDKTCGDEKCKFCEIRKQIKTEQPY